MRTLLLGAAGHRLVPARRSPEKLKVGGADLLDLDIQKSSAFLLLCRHSPSVRPLVLSHHEVFKLNR